MRSVNPMRICWRMLQCRLGPFAALALASACSFGPAPTAHAGVDDLVCESDGMAGFAFGDRFIQSESRLLEITDSGITYYFAEPDVGIEPFECLVIGVTPASGLIFSISLELHGEADVLDQEIAHFKGRLARAHPDIHWLVIGNHHYGENVDGLDLAIYRIGDMKDGKPTHLLTYDCESRHHRKTAIDEARDFTGPMHRPKRRPHAIQ